LFYECTADFGILIQEVQQVLEVRAKLGAPKVRLDTFRKGVSPPPNLPGKSADSRFRTTALGQSFDLTFDNESLVALCVKLGLQCFATVFSGSDGFV
jgi:hypothetical protein